MRRITQEAFNAFKGRRSFRKSNTRVKIDTNNNAYMYLFGNLIAKTENGDTLINHCGYITPTTRDRLSAFVRLRMCKGTFIVNEKFEWDKGWLKVNTLS